MTTATKTQATKTKNDAKATVRSAKRDAEALSSRLATEIGRVPAAAKTEVQAIADQPVRPLFFALGVADRTLANLREVPSRLTATPLRQRLVTTASKAGDLAEKAQQRYTEVAKDGQSVVAAVRKQESTQRAERLATRAQSRTKLAVKDATHAVEAGAEAAKDAVTTLG